MSAPVTPNDFKAAMVDTTAQLCSGFNKALSWRGALLYKLVNWLLDADGNLNPAVLGIGTLEFSAAQLTETGRLLCNGRAVSRTTYVNLFGVIGTTFGPGDGVNTFNIPDFQDRFPIGTSGTKPLASTGGEAEHVLTLEELAPHTHPFTVPKDNSPNAGEFGFLWEETSTSPPDYNGVTEEGGGDPTSGTPPVSAEAHNNIPPYLAVFIYIRA